MKQENAYWVLGHKVEPHQPSGDYDMVVGETPKGVPGPPPHHHDKYNEVFFVLEGQMDFMVNGKVQRLKAGESIDITPGTVHTFSNSGDKACRWLNLHSPKGFLSFFEAFGVPQNEEGAVERSAKPEVIRAVIEKCSHYDMHLAPQPASST
ncbi:cupin domain-containing protein [Zeaxanthinibacter enoshimensis]|uniref:Mannose-6-phosphate isomerase-like protein (Cupin superfamily) n=1 Tax=Zeaxanthinibacter enoshimensis TaxID=392009 RepID=A0A4R6TNL6_9FLAO|nr:cupin domain-containing protein [Zeaxanthinibacter enoshimensis]TDQ33144.1 mannose-6-phosphate isomerase-like protein (cupin superfamily) [Zeaxanthinibacter enoshimensis]